MTTTYRSDRRGDRYYRDSSWGPSPLTGTDAWPSVTTILSVLAKPALVSWAAKIEREIVMEAALAACDQLAALPEQDRRAVLAERIGWSRAHERATREALTIGQEAHAWIAWYLASFSGVSGPEPTCSPAARHAAETFADWARSVDLRPVYIEQTVYHPTRGYAGTLDAVVRMRDGLAILDFKTSKAIYDEYHLQITAYRLALAEMGHPITQAYVIRIPKTDDDAMEIVPSLPSDQAVAAWDACVTLWSWSRRLGGHA